jgi:hypothetical protein
MRNVFRWHLTIKGLNYSWSAMAGPLNAWSQQPQLAKNSYLRFNKTGNSVLFLPLGTVAGMKSPSEERLYISSTNINNGGEGGIRTLGTAQHRTHAFQASPFNHSGTSPNSDIRMHWKGGNFRGCGPLWQCSALRNRACTGRVSAYPLIASSLRMRALKKIIK